jgi:hypothetical protein
MISKDYIPSESSIVRIAQAIRDSGTAMWDFAEEYAVLNALPEFNYRALARAVKDQHDLDIYPPSTATKLRKAYETYVVKAKVSFDEVRNFSPFTLYDVSTLVDINPTNVREILTRVDQTNRDDLLAQLKATSTNDKGPTSFVRLPENVYLLMKEAAQRLGAVVHQKDLSTTVFIEFVSELVINTEGDQLRRLWNVVHGMSDGEQTED